MSSDSIPEKLVAKSQAEAKTDNLDSVRASAFSKKDWTVAIHLAASVPGGPDLPMGFGVDHQLKELKALAKETDGKSVSYVIHAERPLDKHGRPCVDAIKAEDASACIKSDADKAGPVITERYYAHDGKLDRLPDVHYKNADADLVALLKDTQKLAPSNNLQLILQSHGMGVDGIQTNMGPISLKHLNKDIAAGLKGSGKDQVGVLNFDSCNMAETSAVASSKKVARDVVASSAEEQTTPKGDGQKLSENIRALVDNSKMTDVQLGNKIIELARSGVNGAGDESGTPTLSNFDMSKHDEFKSKLDHLGDVLANSVKTHADFKAILSTMDKVTIPETGEDEPEKHNRDLKNFSQHLLDEAQTGKLHNSAEIQKAARDFITAYDAFASNQFGDKESGYDKDGGMTVFLPGSEVLDSKKMVHVSSALYGLDKIMKDNTDPVHPIELGDRAAINEKLQPIYENLSSLWHEKGFSEAKNIDKAWYGIETAKTSADINRAYKQFQDLTHKFQTGAVGRKTEAMMLGKASRVQRDILGQPQESVAPGWDRFIKTMEQKAE